MADAAGKQLFSWAPTWRQRGEAMAKAFIFLALYLFLFQTAMRTIHPKIDISPRGSIFGFLELQSIQFLFGVLIPLSLVLFAFREPVRVAGLGVRVKLGDLLAGLAVGLGLISAVIGVLYLCGDYVSGPLLLSPEQIAIFGGTYLLTMLLVAFCEESVFRGFGLVQLSRAMTFWPAALLTSVVFGLGHAVNGTITVVGVLSVMLAGLMLAYSFKRTGAIYFGVGFHAAWDGGTTFLFGAVAVGLRLPNTMFHADIHGPAWLTGGGAGPIGGVLGMGAFIISGLVVRFFIGRSRDEKDGAEGTAEAV